MTTTTNLPHWDMSVVFPDLDSDEFRRAFDSYLQQVAALVTLFDRLGIGPDAPTPDDDAAVSAVEALIGSWSDLQESGQTLLAYVRSFITTDSRNTLAQARMSELAQRRVVLAQLMARFTAWVGLLDVESVISGSEVAQQHAFLLRRTKVESRHQMSPSEEELAAELEPSSGTAWARMHGDFASQILVAVQTDSGVMDMPVSAARNLAMSSHRETRRRGYEGELAEWERAAVPLAASLNSIKGQTNVLERRRHWSSPLDAALFNNNIDRVTLESMLAAARDSFPDFRRYLKAKARLLGLDALAWFDIFAPAGSIERTWEYAEAADFIVTQFATYSPKLSEFAARAFRENWVDAEPRPGKRDGAFCMKLRAGESRILANYVCSYDGMSTLAHELGHGYHNLNLAHRPALLRTAPMIMAETASIFCQTLVKEAVLKDAGRDEKVSILEASLQDQCQVVVDILSRFEFESRVLERRRTRELSVDELNDLMLQTQRETYGDGLDQNLLHPYMWAVKPHYYSVHGAFYNYPYMFGLLFGLGLFSQYEADPERFRAGYEDFLSSTGLADAATLAKRFGIDIRTRRFWDESLAVVRRDVDQFESLVDA
jgi:pepF/M3 family oligoendopeptidase